MLSFISWSQFLTTILILLLIYYLLVISRFYKKEIFRFFTRSPSQLDGFPFSNEQSGSPVPPNKIMTEKPVDDPCLSQDVYELLHGLKSLLETAAKAKTIKEELVMALQILLRNYSYLKDPSIKAEINQRVFVEVQNICSITLSEAEMKMLWNG